MFCSKCGNNVPEGHRFCANCGAPAAAPSAAPEQPQQAYTPPTQHTYAPFQQTDTQPQQQYDYQQYAQPYEQPVPVKTKKKVNRKALVIIIAAVVVVAAVAVLLFVLLGGKGGYNDYNDLIDDYFDDFEDSDYNEIYKMYPKQLREAYNKVGAKSGAKAFLETCDSWYGDYGTEIKSWKVREIEEYNSTSLSDIALVMGSTPKQYVDITVDATTEDGDILTFDFDLLLMKDGWYIIQIW